MPAPTPDSRRTVFSGSCDCGINSFEIKVEPSQRFVCHCLYCQSFVGKTYTDVVMLANRDIILHQDHVTYRNPRILPPGFAKSRGHQPRFGNPDKGRFARCANLERATCNECRQPFAETVANMVFIPSWLIREQNDLPPVRHHIYDRFHTDAPASDQATLHDGFLSSQATVMSMVVQALRTSYAARS